MRAHGWTWRELQETPENVIAALALIEEWTARRAQKDADLRGDRT